MHDDPSPAPFLTEVAGTLPGSGGPVLDLACGRGRNARFVAGAGHPVVALDRDADALATAAARGRGLPVHAVRSDLEDGSRIPLRSGTCRAVLVFRFLFRPLSAEIVRVLAPGGILVYETFTTAQRDLPGGPRSDAFLLAPGELPTLFPGLAPLRFEECVVAQPGPQAVARLVARKPEAGGSG